MCREGKGAFQSTRRSGEGAVRHIFFFRFDVGTRAKELVDEAEIAVMRRNAERGVAILRWRSGGAAVLERRGGGRSGACEGRLDAV
jgi:hypothetical protein